MYVIMWGHVTYHKTFGPDQFRRFNVYGIKQTKKPIFEQPNRFLERIFIGR